MSPILLTIIAVLIVSILSLSGAFLFAFTTRKSDIQKYLLPMVSFSTGALLGDVFIHIIPEMAENTDFLTTGLLITLAGIVISFVLEKVIFWRHCHIMPSKESHHDHHHNVGLMNLLGDGVHNFIDGALIAGSFLVSVPLGIATTFAVFFHEIPQEIGDFAVLIYSGYEQKRALFLNFLSACAAFVGAGIILIWSAPLPIIGMYILPLAAGNFVYIAGSDLIPELHKETRLKPMLVQLMSMLAGILIMYALTMVE